MVVLSAEVLSQNQKYPVHYSAAAIEVAPDGQADRDGNYRFHGAFTARRKRSGMLAWPALLLASVGAFAQGGVFVAPQKVGVAITQSVTVTAPAGGVVVNVEVLTVGAQNLDFTGVPGTPTCVATLTAGATCVESVTFKPTAPGMRMGAVVLLDSLNNVLGMTYLSGIGQGGLGVLVPGNLIPVAGDGDYKEKVENNVPATQSDLYLPSGVVLDGSGNLYIADTLHNMIRMVAAPIPPATIGVITTIAGTGAQGDGGDNSLAVNATLDEPDGLAVDGAGNIYIADTANNVIRKITLSTGVITTVAGNGTAGYAGDGSSAISPLTELNAPEGVTVDASGNIYIADTDNNAIRMVSAATGLISTVVGNGTGLPGYGGDGLSATSSQTELNLPDAVAFDMPGNMYIADSRNNRIREVSAGNISTFAGDGAPGYLGDGNAANAAELNAPSGVAVDAAGNVYISDTQNSAIRKVSSASKNISTLVANGTGEYFYPESIAPFAEVFAMIDIRYPFGIALDSSADVYFADSFNNRTREIQSNFAALDFSNSLGTTKTIIRQGSKSATIPQTVENDGNAPLDLTLPGISVDTNDPTGFVNAALATPPTSCPTDTNPFFAALDKNCIVGVVFAPSLSLTFGVGVSSQQLTPTIDIGTSSDTVNSPLVIELVGIAAPLNSTTVTLSSSLNPSTFGQNVTITATVTTGTGSPTGTVTFFDGATQLGTPVTLTGGVATYKSTTFTVGSHAITATYNGDSLHFGSSGTLVPAQVVNEATTTTLISTGSPSVLGASVTFTATVTPGGGGVALPLTDAVTFKDGTTTLCSPTITLAAGKYTATCSTSTLPQGANSIIATYSGDAPSYINGSSSAALAQDVQATSTITIGSSGSPSYYGNPVTFTVAVTSVGTTPATGTVNFYMAGQTQPLNATPLTLSNVGGTGEVGFTTSSLPVSTITVPDVITAIYSGDLNYSGGSPLTPFPQVVNQATTATTVSAAPNPAIATKPVAITAAVTVTQGVSTPTGNVTFTDSLNGGAAVTLACAPQPTVASPTCTTSTLAAGTHSMIATYAGDTNDAGSASAPFALTVVTETVTLNSNTNPSIYGMPVIFTVTVPSIGTVAATGTVNILKAGQANPIGTVTLAGNPGTGTFTTSSLPASTVAAPDVITASYPGDSIYLPLVSAAVNQIVNTASTSTALAAVPATGIAGAPVAITATVKVTQGVATPTGTVAFTDSLNGGAATPLTGSPATLAGGAATINPVLAPGSHSIVATYSGDANDNVSSTTLVLTVVQATTQTVLTSSANPSLVLAPVIFTAKVTGNGGTPTGNVTFTDTFNGAAPVTLACTPQPTAPTATCTLSTLLTGTHSITATYAGDANDIKSTSNTISQIVGTIPTVTDLGVVTTTGPNGQVILVATVLNSPTAVSVISPPMPTGTVTFSTVVGTTLTKIGSVPIDSSGVAILVPSLPTGTYNLEASYAGDTDHSASVSSETQISTAATGFNLAVTPSSVTVPTSGNTTVTVALNSINGFTDTIGLGCASLPAGVNCHFSLINPTVLATNTTNNPLNVALTIDTNNPLGGGTSSMNTRQGSRGVSLAGLFLPLGVLFGCIFWRFRRRYGVAITTALALLLGASTLAVSGCSGTFSQSSATPGTYVIQVTGTGSGSDVSRYQNVTLIITAK